MNDALHAIADRVAAMPVPPRVSLPHQVIPISGAHQGGYAEGHADAIRRVVRLLRWLADGEQPAPHPLDEEIAWLDEHYEQALAECGEPDSFPGDWMERAARLLGFETQKVG